MYFVPLLMDTLHTAKCVKCWRESNTVPCMIRLLGLQNFCLSYFPLSLHFPVEFISDNFQFGVVKLNASRFRSESHKLPPPSRIKALSNWAQCGEQFAAVFCTRLTHCELLVVTFSSKILNYKNKLMLMFCDMCD